MTHGITLTGYCARWASGLVVEPLGTWDSTGQEQLVIESASDEWQGTLTATFWAPGAETGTDMLMDGGTCIVPPEALAAPGNGTVTLRCTNAQGRRISVDLAYHSAGHAQVPGSPSEPTPDLWQQYVEQVAADADRAEQASTAAAGSADAAAKSAEAAAESAKQAAQATADIDAAKDAALEAIQQAQGTGVQAIQQAHQAALDDIATDRQQALTDIEGAGDKQQSAITSSGAAALEAIGRVEQTAIGQVQQAGTTQVEAVQTAGQTQQTAIEQAGQSWQQQIAAAGTAELGRWAPAIWDTAPLAAEHDIYAAEGAPLRVTQQGKTQQETTTGAQLANLPDVDVTGVSGISYKSAGNVVTVDGTATTQISSGETRVGSSQMLTLPTGSYTLSYTSSDASKPIRPYIKVDRPGGTEWVSGNDSFAVDGTETAMMLFVQLEAGTYSKTTISIMLNAGSTALPWEPYTGGAPSPSPDYPQAIEGTGFNGKVTFDGTEAWIVVAGIYLALDNAVPADRACVDRIGFCERFPYRYAYANRCLFFAPKNINGKGTTFYVGKALSAEYGVDVDRWKAALAQWASEGNPLTVYYHAASGTDYTVGISTEDDAGGYHGQVLAIGSPLYGDGSVVDTVANDLPSGCDKAIVLDGSEDEDWRLYDETGYRFFYLTVPPLSLADATVGHANRYPYVVVTPGGENAVYVAGNTSVRLQDATVPSVDALKGSLAANPLKIWYRSTAYTEAADLHIDTVTRRWKMVELDGTEIGSRVAASGGNHYYYQMQDAKFSGGLASGTPGWEDATKSTHFLPGNAFAEKGNLVAVLTHSGVSLCRLGFDPDPFASYQEMQSWLAAQKSDGTPVRVLYQLATPEEYASDPHTLPALGSLPETVKATGESMVEYSADTKHYIDSKLQAIAAQQLHLMIGGIGT